MIICIELMFFSIGMLFVIFSLLGNNNMGQLYMLLIITTAACETAIGVSLLVVAHRLLHKINYDALISLRG
jgi:NADH-quinone oxidoreductase subunit K